jgi:predicted RNase H-like nuclease
MVVLVRPSTGEVRRRVVGDVEALLELEEEPAVVGVDMVIGLPEAAEPGGRACDRQARQLLGRPRSSSVFSPPARAVLEAEDYDEAQRLNRASGPRAPGLTIQAFHLIPKMRALDEAMTPERQRRVREVHPELAFYAMNGDAPVSESKHTEAGRQQRADLLAAHGFSDAADAAAHLAGGSLGADDVLDAHAVCWTARRILAGTAQRVPDVARDEEVPANEQGLRMEIWR